MITKKVIQEKMFASLGNFSLIYDMILWVNIGIDYLRQTSHWNRYNKVIHRTNFGNGEKNKILTIIYIQILKKIPVGVSLSLIFLVQICYWKETTLDFLGKVVLV